MKFVESLIERLSSGASPESSMEMKTSGLILVTGATGGVGRRVVNILQKKGIPFRVLVSYRLAASEITWVILHVLSEDLI